MYNSILAIQVLIVCYRYLLVQSTGSVSKLLDTRSIMSIKKNNLIMVLEYYNVHGKFEIFHITLDRNVITTFKQINLKL